MVYVMATATDSDIPREPLLTPSTVREWIRKHVELDAYLDDPSGPGNSITVCLKFSDEEKPFTTIWIHIPETE